MKIEKSELLRYLGYKGQQYGENIENNIDLAIALCLEKITPRSVIKKYSLVKEPLSLKGANMTLQGQDIAKHLEDCNEAYILGATVGFEIEKTVNKLMKENPLLGVIVDSASICAIESYCDDLCEELQRQNSKQLTWRFSCGYGDFPLEQQKDFVRVLEMQKRIGVFINEDSFMMTPQKSVTAIIGVKETAREVTQSRGCAGKCGNCGNVNCQYRKI
ncbi:MAG: methionine synthase [Clostridia bacterium]|nr:methionine synthase [Clostridia bacterium]MDE7349345.1 methionine synthase [Clostridia bacterium]